MKKFKTEKGGQSSAKLFAPAPPFLARVVSVLVCLASVLAGKAGDVSSPGYEVQFVERGGWPGYEAEAVETLAVQGHYVYAITSSGFRVINVENPIMPVPAGLAEEGGNDIKVQGDYAYLAGSPALVVLDISDPSSPKRIGAYANEKGAQTLAVRGKFAFLVTAGRELYRAQWGPVYAGVIETIDISDPAKPTRVGRWEADEPFGAIAITGDRLAVLSNRPLPGNRVLFLDASDPKNLNQLGAFQLEEGDAFSIQSIAAEGNYAYVWTKQKGLVILDITDSTVPRAAGTLPVGAGAIKLHAAGGLIFTGWTVIDATDPARPKELSALYGAGVANGKYYYTAGDFMIWDLSIPSQPRAVSKWATAFCADLVVSGNHAYMADANAGLRIFDLTDPAAPRMVSGVYLPGDGSINAQINIDGRYVYFWHQLALRLVIIDIEVPEFPKIVSEWSDDTLGHVGKIVISEKKAFIPNESAITIVDLSDPARPKLAGKYVAAPLSGSIAVSGGYAFLPIADVESSDMEIVDVRNPANCRLVATYPGRGGRITSVTIEGSHAFLGYGAASGEVKNSLEIVDISDPGNPRQIGVCPLDISGRRFATMSSGTYSISFAEKIAYVSGGRTGWNLGEASLQAASVKPNQPSGGFSYAPYLAAVDISNLSKPQQVGTYFGNFPSHPNLGPGNLITIASGRGGFSMLEPVLRPRLQLNSRKEAIELAWGDAGPGFKLERAVSLAFDAPWNEVGMIPESVPNGYSLRLPQTEQPAFFRLVKP